MLNFLVVVELVEFLFLIYYKFSYHEMLSIAMLVIFLQMVTGPRSANMTCGAVVPCWRSRRATAPTQHNVKHDGSCISRAGHDASRLAPQVLPKLIAVMVGIHLCCLSLTK